MPDPTFRTSNGRSPSEQLGLVIQELQPQQEDLLAAGNLLRGNIRDRCFADEDLRGGNFIPYSAPYARRKGQNNVDLFGRGAGKHMLNALTVRTEVTPQGGVIEIGIFGDQEMATRAQVHNEGATIRTRLGTGRRRDVRRSNQYGTDIRRQRRNGRPTYQMPQREFLGARPEDLSAMQAIIVDSIRARLDRI